MNKMKVLYLEDNLLAIDNIQSANMDRFQISFVRTITAFDECLFESAEHCDYGAIVLDLCIEMPRLTKEEIVALIPELNRDDVPSYCIAGKNIPLYGLDYFKHVMSVRNKTKNLINQGRVIFFSGHAAKIKSRGIYDQKNEMFRNVNLFDRVEKADCRFTNGEHRKGQNAHRRNPNPENKRRD
ncbi:hypothetical protein FACS1894217_12590 [Clostridia bacterium]|nr:hypothetical protein FACS1894217_12590 [Clostridia bacterium]